MATEVVMPRMGETVDEGTDKVDTEIPVPVTGVLSEIRVQQGETVPVATVIAVIT